MTKTINFCEIKNRDNSLDCFYHSILIYLKKPQVVNRKLNTAKNLLTARIKAEKNSFLNLVVKTFDINFTNFADDFLTSNQIEHRNVKIEDEISHSNESSEELLISLEKILPRNAKHNICYQLTFFCTKTHSVSFHALCDSSKILPSIDYTVKYEDNQIKLLIDPKDSENDTNWLEHVLLKKLQNWIESYDENDTERLESNSLINEEEYSVLYSQLKEKYGKKFESIWTEEVTDPKKFIYEDLAIAAYLLTFWKHQRIKDSIDTKQSFVDLGCGNGLLVAILSYEGHQGYGIDIRRRKIWSKFDPSVDLREITWTPSEMLNKVDWVIGNHSDELSPWIPVVTARNSITSNFFLLPCCAYEFSGAKFQRKGTSKSLYMSFIDYCVEISSICGFKNTLMDRLKIPSTKRIVLIGIERSHGIERHDEFKEKIQNFIDSSNKTFVPREKLQAVKNCTKLDKSLAERIVRTIFDALLTEDLQAKNQWNSGKEINLSDAVKLISPEDLKKLKTENGGLQTLLRNKHQIFEVYNGSIKIRKPKRISEFKSSKKLAIKSSPCYFHLYHKQGCLLKEEECCYKH